VVTSDGCIPAPLPYNERERLQVLKSYCVLDSPREPGFDHLTALASALFHAPIVLISLIDEKRQFFKSSVGVSITESSRDSSFCAYSILNDEPLMVFDTLQDSRFRTNPFVVGEPHIRFYAGAPLVGKDGMMLGSFSIADRVPRSEFPQVEQELLKRFAVLAVQGLEQRLHAEHIARVEREILEANERYKLATQATTDGIWEWDYATDELYQSARLRAIVGMEAVDVRVPLEDWLNRIHPSDRAGARLAVERFKASEISSYKSEYRVLHHDGTWRWVLNRGVSVRDAEGRLLRVVGAVSDITGPKFVDSLTGLYTRTFLLDCLEQRMQQKSTSGKPYALFLLDLDLFKRVNSSLGRNSGDLVLIECGRRIAETIAPESGNFAARISGDEFAIFVDSVEEEKDALHYAGLVQSRLMLPFPLRSQQVMMTASIGIAMESASCTSAGELIQRGEVARNESQNAGGAQALLFSEKMQDKIIRQMRLTSDLREAIARETLELHYQPKLSLRTEEVVGFEALLRWFHPKYGAVPPEEFISIAEECDLIVELGRWTLRKAMEQLAQWRAAGLVSPKAKVAVNLSPRQLSDLDLSAELSRQLAMHGLPAACLDLEVTEGLLIADTKAALDILLELKSLGFGLHLDDFGTGYSSLSYLQKFPFDSLKVDRSFIHDMEKEEDRATLVRSIIALGHSLDLNVIAEGIETEEHLKMLKAMGCNYGQGYYFSRPLAAAAIEEFLISRK
jgi:diguanylate cyclase (GGDEF)-like protein/PAS domain S-box-containing protein